MNVKELIQGNIALDLVAEIQNMDLNSCTDTELLTLSNWVREVKERADFLTLEDEIVGYTYSNLDALTPKMECEEAKRGIQLVKVRKNYK